MSEIFWFSGTGNSLYAAKLISAGLDNMALYSMRSGVPKDQVGGEGEMIGFVYPSYYGNLPRIVRSFADKIRIKEGTYIFGLVTMGGLGFGSVAALGSLLKKKGLHLDYGKGIRMPANYVMNYNPADPSKSDNILDVKTKKIQKIANEISTRRKAVQNFKFTANNLYRDVESLDVRFISEDSCTGCGICAEICSVNNIQINDGRPTWRHHCEHCCACISWCPEKAIQYGNITNNRRRYTNPRVGFNDMIQPR